MTDAVEKRTPTNTALALLAVLCFGTSMIPNYILAIPSVVIGVGVLSAVAGSAFLKLVKSDWPPYPSVLAISWLIAAGTSASCGLLIALFSDPIHALFVAGLTAIIAGISMGLSLRAASIV